MGGRVSGGAWSALGALLRELLLEVRAADEE
jgi:hypothetical protein